MVQELHDLAKSLLPEKDLSRELTGDEGPKVAGLIDAGVSEGWGIPTTGILSVYSLKWVIYWEQDFQTHLNIILLVNVRDVCIYIYISISHSIPIPISIPMVFFS